MNVLTKIKTWARIIRRDALTLLFACRDPRTPMLVKALCGFVVAYAFSPIDLIPDFIPCSAIPTMRCCCPRSSGSR